MLIGNTIEDTAKVAGGIALASASASKASTASGATSSICRAYFTIKLIRAATKAPVSMDWASQPV